jgi:septum formation protein
VSGLVLASRSPARARLLAAAGVDVDLRPTDVDEAALKAEGLAAGQTPREVAQLLASAKALAVDASDVWVIGADQTLDLEGALFDKPADLAAAETQLEGLRGRVHQLHAAVTVVRGREIAWQAVGTVTLRMRAFSDAFLRDYLAQEGTAILGCVGAYRFEGLGAQLFEAVEGDYFSILGLPLLPLLTFLRSVGALAT